MPTPVLTNTMLGWAYQTEVINNVLPTSSFLKRLMFGNRELTLPTESVELSYLVGDHKMAPFVEVNGEAKMIDARSSTFDNVSCPNIRIKRPMEAYQVLNKRQPGTGIFVEGSRAILNARRKAIGEDAQYMRDLIDVREEWMVAQLLTDTTAANMSISYQVAEGANWKVSVPRPHATDFVRNAGATWDGSTSIELDFHKAKEIMSKYQRLVPNVCVMGSTAAAEFITNAGVKALLDKRNISAGALQLTSQFNESGAIYLGSFCGIECWQYNAEYVSDAGVSTPFVGAAQAIFLHTSPANRSLFYYGAIPDHDAMDQGMFEGKIFSKAWKEKDPSVYVQLAHTRPLPHIRKTGAVLVMAT